MKASKLTDEERAALHKSPMNYVPEQERNFDNKTIPKRPMFTVTGSCEIKGVHYNIVDYVTPREPTVVNRSYLEE